MTSRSTSSNQTKNHAWSKAGGGVSGCAIAGSSSGNTPIATDLSSGLPGAGEMIAILAIIGLLVVVGRWAFQHLAPAPALATDGHPATARHSDELWREFDQQADPVEV